jgi:hypothetical protein
MIEEIGRFLACAADVAVSARRDQLGGLLSDLLEPQVSIAE